MRTVLFLCLLFLGFTTSAQDSAVLRLDTNGVILSPTNFFYVNRDFLTSIVATVMIDTNQVNTVVSNSVADNLSGYPTLQDVTNVANELIAALPTIGTGVLAFAGNGSGLTNVGTKTAGTGSNNTVLGVQSLRYNTTGSADTALGYKALYSNAGGSSNAAVGANALGCNWSGSGNSALGYQAGYSVVAGSRNIFIGANAGCSEFQPTWVTNSVAIGAGSYTTTNDQVVIGNNQTKQILLKGIVTGDGGGLTNIGASVFEPARSTVYVSSPTYSITNGNSDVFVDGSGIITLPSAALSTGNRLYLSASSSDILVTNCNGSQTIAGQFLSITLKAFGSIMLVSDGQGWR